jgi:bilirubin oxidase
VNACGARYVRLSLGGRPFRIIGGDGGLRTDALTVDEVLLAPAERVELAVGPFEDEGAEIAIESLPYRRTSMKRPRRDRWGTLRVGPRAPSVASIPAPLATIESLVPTGPIQPTRTVRFGAHMTLHGHDWLINDEQHHHDAPVKVGELQVWERSGSSSTRPAWITRFTCTDSSSRSSRSTARRRYPGRGRTP